MIPVSLSISVTDSKVVLTATDDASQSPIMVAHLSPSEFARLVSGSMPTVPAYVVSNLETRRIGQRPRFSTRTPPETFIDIDAEHPNADMIFWGENTRADLGADTATWHRDTEGWKLHLVTWVSANTNSTPSPDPLDHL